MLFLKLNILSQYCVSSILGATVQTEIMLLGFTIQNIITGHILLNFKL